MLLLLVHAVGGNLTTNLREFFNRAKSHKASKKEEQDLKGFGGPGGGWVGGCFWGGRGGGMMGEGGPQGVG